MKKLFLVLLSLFCLIPAIVAQRFCVDGLYYQVFDTEKRYVALVSSREGYHYPWIFTMVAREYPWLTREPSADYSGNIVIPEKVTYNGIEYTVTEIAMAAFTQCTNLKNVVMPNTITAIGPGAFYKCTSLETIKFSPNIRLLWDTSLAGCSSLKYLDLSTFESVEFVVEPSMHYVILPANGIYYSFRTHEDYKCKFIFPGEHPPFPMFVSVSGLPKNCTLYCTAEFPESFNMLFMEFANTIIDPEAVEHANVSDVEVPKTEVAVSGNVVTAPQAYSVTICDVAGAVVAQLPAGASMSLEAGAYIASSNGSTPVKFIIK